MESFFIEIAHESSEKSPKKFFNYVNKLHNEIFS